MFILTQPAGQHLTEHFYIEVSSKSQLSKNDLFWREQAPALIGISSKSPLHDIIKAQMMLKLSPIA